MPKSNVKPGPSQHRIGRAVLRAAAVLVPVEIQDNGAWSLAGVVRVAPAEVGFQHVPKSHSGRQRLVGRAVQRVRTALRN